MTTNQDVLAYLKYYGDLVEDGYLDAKKSADALYGFDKSLRYFLYQENSDIQDIEFEIPIKIQKGSWEALIPENIEQWIKTIALISAGAYSKKALEKMAERDFEKIGFKDIFKKAFQAFLWVIKIAKHLKTMRKRDFKDVEFTQDNKIVIIKNDENQSLSVPIEYLEKYAGCPENIFAQITKIIEPQRELEIGLNDTDVKDDERKVRVAISEKQIFYSKDEDDEILFPELQDGQYIELGGHITRGNENSNTIGFFYKGHVLTCSPEKGNINEHKSKLFSNCLIKGRIDRISKEGELIEKRPRIIFSELILLDKPFLDLFSNEET
ncbi:hypothetical protein A8C56_20800 [Niabella ginsenosidivorans]|uniref:Uncharacterized protein n=1 Tax=Niabella ginsenosidivorans TaxID=1176587 RepID=A0A1A9I996_9BACT|nr:hypothetical protein [Niabella ginsenosidivorans]ANH83094.1 hypothetical protein A8C56_20800 [Niabella ginsenosidivorans]